MRNEDLIPCFVDLLSDLNEERSLEWQKHFANELEATKEFARLDKMLGQIEERMNSGDDRYYSADDDSDSDLSDLFDELGTFALPYFHFGAHEGDGSDYGFWLSSDSLEDFDGLRVDDLSEVPADYSGEVLHVNDHGNASLYACENGECKEIWAIV